MKQERRGLMARMYLKLLDQEDAEYAAMLQRYSLSLSIYMYIYTYIHIYIYTYILSSVS
jgi:hypothetical protein